MKKTTILLTIIISIFIFSSISFANSGIKISVNGTSMAVPEVNVLMNNVTLKSEVPSFIMVDRTLVPIRFVAESFGAKVDWDNSTQTARVSHQGKTVDLTIDSKVVVIDGKKVNLHPNAIPKLVSFKDSKDSRTMVPVRFVSEVLGYDVGWDPATYTAKISSPIGEVPTQLANVMINNIDLIKSPDGNHKILIKSDREIKYTKFFLSASSKLVIDIENSKLNNLESFSIPYDVTAMDETIQRVQYSQFTTDPYTTRIVLTLSENIEPKIEKSNDKKETTIYFKESMVQDEIINQDTNANYNGNRVQALYLDQVDGKEGLVIKGTKESKYNIIKLSDPDRIVIDIKDSLLEGEQLQKFNYSLGYIKGVRVSQFVPDSNYQLNEKIVRVVLDITEGQDKPDISVISKGGDLIIYPKENMWKDIKYEYLNNQALFNIKNSSKSEYQVFYDQQNKDLHIEILGKYSQLPEGIYSINDKLVKQISLEKKERSTNLIVSFKQNIAYSLLSKSGDDIISILASRDSNISPSERTIVVDPGHGGSDPGAVIGGLYEKDITTPISLLLRDALEESGYKVIMTRENDKTLELFDRPKYANDNNVDLFISMHANATLKPQVRGLEVLYRPATVSDIKLEDQYPFAKSIYDNILAITNKSGRGIFKRTDLAVLNRTYMPAVLVEIGYMSNPEELQVILTQDYQRQVVQGIVNGVKEYLGD